MEAPDIDDGGENTPCDRCGEVCCGCYAEEVRLHDEVQALTAERDVLQELTDRQVARTGTLTGQVDALLKEVERLKGDYDRLLDDIERNRHDPSP